MGRLSDPLQVLPVPLGADDPGLIPEPSLRLDCLCHEGGDPFPIVWMYGREDSSKGRFVGWGVNPKDPVEALGPVRMVPDGIPFPAFHLDQVQYPLLVLEELLHAKVFEARASHDCVGLCRRAGGAESGRVIQGRLGLMHSE